VSRLHTLPVLLINRFAVVSTGWKTMSSAIPADPVPFSYVFVCLRARVPAPNTLAIVDSFLNSFADDCVPAATLATLAATSGTCGAIVNLSVWVRPREQTAIR
jgi:hypothetical protein